MPKKLKYEYVFNYFKEHHCELLETEYANNSTKLRYICKCGSESTITFNNFKNGSRCLKCSGLEKLTYKKIFDYINKFNFKLLSKEYIGYDNKLEIECSEGHIFYMSFHDFKNGCRCKYCSGNIKLTFEQVKTYIESIDGYILISNEYKNNRSKLDIKCPKGHIFQKSFNAFKDCGQRCSICFRQPISIERITEVLKDKGIELLHHEWINKSHKLKLKCKRGHIFDSKFIISKNKIKRCSICYPKYVKNNKLSFHNIFDYIKSEGYDLITLEKDYKNTMSKITIKCPNNHIYDIRFSSFKYQNSRCEICTGRNKKTFDYVKKYIESNSNYKILSPKKDYKNSKTKLKVSCKNNHEFYIRFNDFQQGHKWCRKCYDEYNTGETHSCFNPDRESIKMMTRLRRTFDRTWINKNMQNDPNYNDYLNNKSVFNLDHIIPVSLFRDIVINYNLNPEEIKKIINKKENLQLLTKEENLKKHSHGNIFEAAQYLMLNGIKL